MMEILLTIVAIYFTIIALVYLFGLWQMLLHEIDDRWCNLIDRIQRHWQR